MNETNVTLLENRDCAHIRGFNYQPSFASHGIDIWGRAFDSDAVDREIGAGRRHYPGIDTLRLWMSHDAWMVDPAVWRRNVDAVMDMADRHGVRFVMTLFNGWHSIPPFGGFTPEQLAWTGEDGFEPVFGRYVRELVEPYREDPRIAFWDLSNEPLNNAPDEKSRDRVLRFLARVREVVKACGAVQPIGVSHQGITPEVFEAIDAMSDVLFFHPYWTRNRPGDTRQNFLNHVERNVNFANRVGKALLATECCWGSWDDAERAEIVRFELGELSRRGIGFLCHLLHETRVADGHRPDRGITVPRGAGYMAFVNADGAARPYHDVFNEFCPDAAAEKQGTD